MTDKEVIPSVDNNTTGAYNTALGTTAIKELQDFAHANYEDGGHWVYESFDCADYQEVIDDNKGNMDLCKARLRHHWEQLCMLEKEYSFGDGEY
jgi:hypothetical protein